MKVKAAAQTLSQSAVSARIKNRERRPFSNQEVSKFKVLQMQQLSISDTTHMRYYQFSGLKNGSLIKTDI